MRRQSPVVTSARMYRSAHRLPTGPPRYQLDSQRYAADWCHGSLSGNVTVDRRRVTDRHRVSNESHRLTPKCRPVLLQGSSRCKIKNTYLCRRTVALCFLVSPQVTPQCVVMCHCRPLFVVNNRGVSRHVTVVHRTRLGDAVLGDPVTSESWPSAPHMDGWRNVR